VLVLALIGCGRVGYQREPPLDGGSFDAGSFDAGTFDAGSFDAFVPDSGPAIDSGPSCASLAGRACSGTEICRAQTVATTDVADCCTDDCIDPTGRMIVDAPRATAPIVVDGAIGDWTGATRYPIALASVGGMAAATDLSGSFSVAWDDSNLYLLIEVNDTTLRPVETGLPWQDDSIEIYIDMDARSIDMSWDADEMWCYVNQNNTTTIGTSSMALFPTVISFATRTGGWRFELAVDWPAAVPSGLVVGFDVAVNDDDGPAGASRSNQIFWNDGSGQLYRDASLVGLLRLAP
jgi:hypothetical protein